MKITHMKSPVIQSEDYYPFGLTFNSYRREDNVPNRWKFQGQEHVDDLNLGWDSFKWRNHQPEIGRFFNVDPLADKYAYNSPVSLRDPNGAEIWLSFTHQNENGEEVTTRLEYRQKKLYTEDGNEYDGSDAADPIFQLVKGQLNAIQELTEGESGGDEVAKIFSDLESAEVDHDINIFLAPYNPDGETPEEKHVNFNRPTKWTWGGSETFFNPLETRDADKKEAEVNPMIQLLHELKHAHDRFKGTRDGSRYVENEVTGVKGIVSDYEFRAVDTENILRKAMGVPRRTSYAGFPVPYNFVNH